jgi:hypothetical protein
VLLLARTSPGIQKEPATAGSLVRCIDRSAALGQERASRRIIREVDSDPCSQTCVFKRSHLTNGLSLCRVFDCGKPCRARYSIQYPATAPNSC